MNKSKIPGKDFLFPNKLFLVKIIVVILLIIFSLGILFPVVSPEFNGKIFVVHLLSNIYSIVCHQSESALVHLNDNHLLVCARCTGIYFGALMLLLLILIKPVKVNVDLKPLFIFSIPLIIDAIAVRLSIYPYSTIIAFITGLLFGAIVLFYILDAIENSFYTQYDEKYEY